MKIHLATDGDGLRRKIPNLGKERQPLSKLGNHFGSFLLLAAIFESKGGYIIRAPRSPHWRRGRHRRPRPNFYYAARVTPA